MGAYYSKMEQIYEITKIKKYFVVWAMDGEYNRRNNGN